MNLPYFSLISVYQSWQLSPIIAKLCGQSEQLASRGPLICLNLKKATILATTKMPTMTTPAPAQRSGKLLEQSISSSPIVWNGRLWLKLSRN